MRHVFIVSLLVASLAVSGAALAASSSTLPVTGTVTSTGTLSASKTTTVGGVSGTLTSSGGNWTMTVGGVTFASGTYSCSGGGCTYTGTVVGSSTAFSFKTTAAGTTASATGFSTHGAWVSTVAHWAGAHQAALDAAGMTVGHIISGAAKIEGQSTISHGQGGGGEGSGHGGGHNRQ